MKHIWASQKTTKLEWRQVKFSLKYWNEKSDRNSYWTIYNDFESYVKRKTNGKYLNNNMHKGTCSGLWGGGV